MKQGLHIFRKDARYLGREITVFILFAAIYSRFGGYISGPDILLEIAAIWLIARAVHAEPLVDDRQFWLTRPYDWRSLLCSKLLFIAAFVCVPVGLAQFAMVIQGHFSVWPAIPGLLWSQVAIFSAGVLIAALAAMTSTTTFMLAVLGFVALIAVAINVGSRLIIYGSAFPLPVVWIRDYSILAIFVLSAGLICLWQYRDHASARSWVAATAGVVLTILVFLFMPSSFAIAAQSLLAGKAGAGIQVAVEPRLKGNGTESFRSGRGPLYRRVRVAIPLNFHGIPDGMEVRAEALSVNLEWPGDRAWSPDVPPGFDQRSGSLSEASVLMDSGLYEARRNAPLTISGAVYVTLFGDSQTRTAQITNRPVNFQDGIQCAVGAIGDIDTLFCRSMFRWPARLVYAKSGATEEGLQNTLISYSPFPAELSLTNLEVRTGGTLRGHELTIVTKRPLSHFWINLRAAGIQLADFEGQARAIQR